MGRLPLQIRDSYERGWENAGSGRGLKAFAKMIFRLSEIFGRFLNLR